MNLNLLIPPTASPRPQSRGQSRGFGGTMSRASMGAGGFGPGPGPVDPAMMNTMFKDRFSYINTAKGMIEKQREFDTAVARLQKEFD